jgi:hypothetical protein
MRRLGSDERFTPLHFNRLRLAPPLLAEHFDYISGRPARRDIAASLVASIGRPRLIHAREIAFIQEAHELPWPKSSQERAGIGWHKVVSYSLARRVDHCHRLHSWRAAIERANSLPCQLIGAQLRTLLRSRWHSKPKRNEKSAAGA